MTVTAPDRAHSARVDVVPDPRSSGSTPPDPSSHSASWPLSALVSVAAALVSVGVMFGLRSSYQIRTLPERVMEWVLIYVSPDMLEQGLAQFGAQAKVYALYVAVGGMALMLIALGAALMRAVRSPWGLFAVGPLLYLVAMAGIMPLTGAGLFGTELLQDSRLVNAGYLVVALSYALVLVLGRWIVGRDESSVAGGTVAKSPSASLAGVGSAGASRSVAAVVPSGGAASRRAALTSLGATALAAVATLWFGQRGAGPGSSSLPLARVQITPRPTDASAPAPAASGAAPASGSAPAPVPAPATAAVPASGALPKPAASPASAAAPAAPVPAASPIVAAPASPEPPAPSAPVAAGGRFPTPPPMAQLARDQDGALVGSTRQPGTLSAAITPTEDHYHVTKNPVSDPIIDPASWTLALDGEVNSPVQLDYATLRQLPTVEIAKTLECVSNLTDKCELVPFGCELIATARWTGVRLVDILDLAGGLKGGVVSVQLIGEDEFVSSIPPEAALDPNTVVAYEMNGAVLPYEHGFPARILVPGRYGYKSPKWIRVIRPARREVLDWYGQRNWNREGIVRTMTRIDLPAPGATLPAGPQRVAGIAYASNRGVSKVEFSADNGASWTVASFIEPQVGVDAWVRWESTFEMPAGGTRTLVARATDGQGTLQTEAFSLAQPDGASGWNHIEVKGA